MPYDFQSIPRPEWPKIPPKVIKGVLLGLAALVLLWGSFYQVSPEELGVILRFGKFVRTSEPGLHVKLPLGIERLTRVPVQRQLKEEYGFRTVRAGINSEFVATAETKGESVMLTGDLNVVDAEWIVQFKIRDPFLFLFKMREARSTFRDMTEAIVRRVVGDSSVDEVITVGRTRIADEAKALLQDLCDAYEIGIEVNQLIFQDVNPPEPVKPSFNDVNEALQEKEKKINESWAEYNQVIPRASGEAEQVLRGAEGYATERVNNAAGDANRFSTVYKEYAKAPVVTRKRLYLEALNDILPKISRKIVVDQNQKNLLPLLNLGEEVKK
jgi:membrane protease subunit HflK